MGGKRKATSDTESKVVPIRPQGDVSPLKVLSVNQLLQNEYEPVKWIIPDILPEGLTLFCAAPKIGKSMVALAIALRMARRVHGGIEGDTLYLSLDDVSERRLQSRTRSLLQGKEVNDHVFFATESESLDTGLIDQLEQWMSVKPATALIIVDVYGTIKPKRVGDDIYKNDYNALNSLRTFATKHRIAVILIHHTRKKKDDDDWINNINGSNGLAGACDTLWYLKRARGSQDMKLCIDGREDGLASEVGLTLEDLDLPWNIDGVGTPQDLNKSEQLVTHILQQQGTALTPKQIAELTDLKLAHAQKITRRMLVKNLLTQTKYGLYELPLETDKTDRKDRIANNNSPVTLDKPALEDTSEARLTKAQNSAISCQSVSLASETAPQDTSQRLTKTDNNNILCQSVSLADVPEEPEWIRESYSHQEPEETDTSPQTEEERLKYEEECLRYNDAVNLLAQLPSYGLEIEYSPNGEHDLKHTSNGELAPTRDILDGFNEEIQRLDSELRDILT